MRGPSSLPPRPKSRPRAGIAANYIVRRLRTGRPSDETPWLPNKLYRTESDEIHWLPNKEMTKLSGSMTKLRPRTFSRTFRCQTLSSVTRRLSIFGSGGRVRSPRVRLGVDLGGRGRGRRGGVFPKTTLDFLDSLQTRTDPTRPRPRSPIFISCPATRPPPTRPHTGEW